MPRFCPNQTIIDIIIGTTIYIIVTLSIVVYKLNDNKILFIYQTL